MRDKLNNSAINSRNSANAGSAKTEGGAAYFEYLIVVATFSLSLFAAIPNVKLELKNLDTSSAAVAAANDAYPTPLLP